MVVCPCPPISEQTTSGENPWERGKQISAKVYLRSEDQQEQENIQKLSSSYQRSCLCKGKSCLIKINVFNDCAPLHFNIFKRIVPLKYVHLLADGIC